MHIHLMAVHKLENKLFINMSKKINQNKIIIYQAKNGAIEFRGDFKHETIWATQAQIVELFNVDQSLSLIHI